jgi:hypothetical protein
MKDIEGTTMPEPKKPEDKTKDNVEAYQKMVSEDFRKKREERAKELEKKFGVEDDVDI